MLRSDSMRLAALASALSLVVAGSAFAQSGGTGTMSGLKLAGDQPIEIESDKLEVRENESLAIFTGNVQVIQGPTLLKAGSMDVYYVNDKGGNADAAAGSATTGTANIDRLEVRDKVYIKSDTQVATGDRGTFDMKTEVLVLSGDKVVLSDGDNVLTGCKLTVQMKTGLAQVEACGKRVMMSISPGSQKKP
ncbi:LptA/OstA family protein [Aquamicrobium lusatiense]|uniref:Lipopolysaccharide export system protein LptA n=1 Tax=Aquamicrobium lusatiense TaxID=89772 RepID=A0A7W9VW49_9HYPH|nr:MULTISPECIES: LptA/OstA family protein [Aquamicrobium]MBB6013713.1 lipopolysaccharide export system protein LptA [Aquamicrobium lusatiense]MCK9552393.1 LptA/OstA family protein [Aquamicrobium sp.]MDH4991087.1 LptA/OstA family protein [Aquamicrobium lusatiense]